MKNVEEEEEEEEEEVSAKPNTERWWEGEIKREREERERVFPIQKDTSGDKERKSLKKKDNISRPPPPFFSYLHATVWAQEGEVIQGEERAGHVK